MKHTRIFPLLALLLATILPAQTLFHSHGTLPAGLVGKPEERAKKKITAKFNVCCFLFREDIRIFTPVTFNPDQTVFRFRFNVLVAVLLLSVTVFAQRNYTALLISQGIIPKRICGTPKQRAENTYILKDIKDDFQKQFILFDEECFQFHINSGRITFGDTVSRYCNKILNKLIPKYIPIDFSPQIFLLHSTTSAPLSFSNGIILLPTTLLASLSSEDQLAFIIAREVINIRENTRLNRFGRLVQLDDSEKTNALTNFDNNLLEQELFSDKRALELIQDAGYNAFASISALQILTTTDTIYKAVDFDTHYFERKGYQLHSSFHTLEYEVIEYDTIKINESRKRINTLNKLVKDIKPKTELSNKIQQICFFDLAQLLLLENELPEALYFQYLILLKDSTNNEAQICISKILFNLCIYDNELAVNNEPSTVNISTKDIIEQTFNELSNSSNTYYYRPFNLYPGYSQRTSRFLSHLRPEDLIVLAIEMHMRLLQDPKNDRQQITNRLNLLSFQLQAFAPVNYYWCYLHRLQQLNPNIRPDETTIIQKNQILAKNDTIKSLSDLDELKLKIENPNTFKDLLFDSNNRIIVDTAKKNYSLRALLTMNCDKAYSDAYRTIDLRKDSINSAFLLNLNTEMSDIFATKTPNKKAILAINTSSFKQEVKKIKKQNVKTKTTLTIYDHLKSEILMDSTINTINKTLLSIPTVNINFESEDSVNTNYYNTFCLSQYADKELNSLRYSDLLCPLAYPLLSDSLIKICETSIYIKISVIEFSPLIHKKGSANANRIYVSVTDLKTREIKTFLLQDYLTINRNWQTTLIITSLNENLKMMSN